MTLLDYIAPLLTGMALVGVIAAVFADRRDEREEDDR